MTEVKSIRLPPKMLYDLRKLAHIKSIQEEREISWPSLVRETIEDLLHRASQDSDTIGNDKDIPF